TLIEPAAGTLAYIYKGINDTDYESSDAPTAVGEYEVTAAYAGSNNYRQAIAVAHLVITDAADDLPELSLSNLTVVYDGQPHAIGTATCPTGLTVTYFYRGAGYNSTTPPTNAGIYRVTATTAATDEYSAGEVTAKLTILKAQQVIDFILPESVPYGSPVLNINATVNGAAADGATVYKSGNTNSATINTGNVEYVNAGVAAITVSHPGDNNYLPASLTKTVTVTRAQLLLTLDSETVPYTGSPVYITPATLAGAVGDAVFTITYSYKLGDVTDDHAQETGLYTVTATVAGDANHIGNVATATLEVTKAQLELHFSGNETVTYTGAPLYISPATLTGAGGSTEFPVTYSYKLGDVTTDHALNVAVYEVTATVTGNSYYEGTTATATFTVVKATPVITLVSVSTLYTGKQVTVNTPVVTGSLTANQLAVTLIYEGINGTDYPLNISAPTEAGHYRVTAHTDGDSNHNPATTTTTILIGPATPTMSIADASKVYDGAPLVAVAQILQSTLTITYSYAGTLKDGTNYPATATPPTEAGDYTVTASTAGNADYTAAQVMANLEIIPAQAVIEIHGKTAKYTGSPIGINAPVVITPAGGTMGQVIYKGILGTVYAESSTAPVEVGTYQASASYGGSNNYLATVVTARLTITQRDPGLSLANKTVVYNTQPQGYAAGDAVITPPEAVGELAVTYTYHSANYPASTTPPTNAGTYSVSATTLANEHYAAGEVTARLIIKRAPQTITFTLPASMATGAAQVNIDANASSGLTPLVYASGNEGIATIVNGVLTPLATGVAAITVSQAGDHNWLPASVTKTVTVTAGGGNEIITIEVDGNDIPVADNMTYVAPCGGNNAKAVIGMTVSEGATVSYRINGVTTENVGTNFEITLGEPQIKKVYIIVKSQDGSATKEYLLNIEVRFPFFQIVVMRWNNTLTVINNPENNKGYAFNTFKWYRSTDGGATFETFSNEQSWSAGANGELLSETVLYYVEVTSDLFEGTLRTCVDHVTLKENMKVTAYPNPVTKGQTVYIDVDIDDTSLLEGAFIEVYDVAGRRLNHFEAQGSHTEVTVDYPMGVYLFVFKGINGFHHELKIAITK
ncbi:MAG: MBG domain-containing protein, partial [Cytophagaceae bacterium]|nr:MBG domain-containing protein [Cytophagaceae bacterium]